VRFYSPLCCLSEMSNVKGLVCRLCWGEKFTSGRIRVCIIHSAPTGSAGCDEYSSPGSVRRLSHPSSRSPQYDSCLRSGLKQRDSLPPTRSMNLISFSSNKPNTSSRFSGRRSALVTRRPRRRGVTVGRRSGRRGKIKRKRGVSSKIQTLSSIKWDILLKNLLKLLFWAN